MAADAGYTAPGARYFEEMEPGVVVTTPARTITEHDVVAFAGLSGDYNPLHTDSVFAESTPFGERIAHGMLGLSVATGLAARLGILEGTALAFLGLDWKFRKPILFGDTVHAVLKVDSAKPMPAMGGGIVSFSVRLRNQDDDVVGRGSWSILLRMREGLVLEEDGAG